VGAGGLGTPQDQPARCGVEKNPLPLKRIQHIKHTNTFHLIQLSVSVKMKAKNNFNHFSATTKKLHLTK
jgi:hypothetical protein